jgi:hypothetical protein
MKQRSLFTWTPRTAFSDDERAAILADPHNAARAAWSALDDLFAYVANLPSGSGCSRDLQTLRATMPDDPQTQMLYYLNFIHHHPTIGWHGYLKPDEQALYLYAKAETLLTCAHLVAHGEVEKARITLG